MISACFSGLICRWLKSTGRVFFYFLTLFIFLKLVTGAKKKKKLFFKRTSLLHLYMLTVEAQSRSNKHKTKGRCVVCSFAALLSLAHCCNATSCVTLMWILTLNLTCSAAWAAALSSPSTSLRSRAMARQRQCFASFKSRRPTRTVEE